MSYIHYPDMNDRYQEVASAIENVHKFCTFYKLQALLYI